MEVRILSKLGVIFKTRTPEFFIFRDFIQQKSFDFGMNHSLPYSVMG